VQSTNGDTHLGGDDIDNLLTAIALDEIHAEHGVDLRGHPSAVQALRKAAIEAKISLSTETWQSSISNCPTATAISARFRAQFLSC
jgi:molecular chaperone DnaK (HSP70)